MNLTGPDILAELQKIQEAYCVLHSLPTERQHADAELVPAFGALIAAEAELAGLARVEAVRS